MAYSRSRAIAAISRSVLKGNVQRRELLVRLLREHERIDALGDFSYRDFRHFPQGLHIDCGDGSRA